MDRGHRDLGVPLVHIVCYNRKAREHVGEVRGVPDKLEIAIEYCTS